MVARSSHISCCQTWAQVKWSKVDMQSYMASLCSGRRGRTATMVRQICPRLHDLGRHFKDSVDETSFLTQELKEEINLHLITFLAAPFFLQAVMASPTLKSSKSGVIICAQQYYIGTHEQSHEATFIHTLKNARRDLWLGNFSSFSQQLGHISSGCGHH